MKKLIGMLCLLFLSCLAQPAQAQTEKTPITQSDYQNDEVEMADRFRADGKIYVVVAVVLLILLGMLAYAFTIDRKLSRLEKEVNNALRH
jgi:uncharacterized membrane protein